jgi:hypothetical protein
VKKTAVVILALALLMTFAAVPVMAKPTKGQKVPLKEYITGSDGIVPPAREWVTKGGIFQMRGEQEFLTVRFFIGDPSYATYDFDHTIVGYGSWNTKTGVFVARYDCVWTLASDDSSGFSGNMELRAYNFNLDTVTGTVSWSSWSAHEVAQGFGYFAGQTLMLSINGPYVPTAPWTGYLLKG